MDHCPCPTLGINKGIFCKKQWNKSLLAGHLKALDHVVGWEKQKVGGRYFMPIRCLSHWDHLHSLAWQHTRSWLGLTSPQASSPATENGLHNLKITIALERSTNIKEMLFPIVTLRSVAMETKAPHQHAPLALDPSALFAVSFQVNVRGHHSLCRFIF